MRVILIALTLAACAAQTPKPPAEEDTGPPVLKRGRQDGKRTRTEAPPTPIPTSTPAEAQASAGVPQTPAARPSLIDRARVVTADFDAGLPNFICNQKTLRYTSKTARPDWNLKDIVENELVYFDGREDYRNFRVNGKALKKGTPEDSGSWSRGDFGTALVDVLSPATNANFQRRAADERLAGFQTAVYDFTVKQPNSHWEIRYGSTIRPAYRGTIWIDQDSARVIRMEMQARELPASYELDTVEMTVEYGWVEIAGQSYLLPLESDNLVCLRGTHNCSRNHLEFKNYRRFSSESSISTTDSNVTFDGEKPPPKEKKP